MRGSGPRWKRSLVACRPKFGFDDFGYAKITSPWGVMPGLWPGTAPRILLSFLCTQRKETKENGWSKLKISVFQKGGMCHNCAFGFSVLPQQVVFTPPRFCVKAKPQASQKPSCTSHLFFWYFSLRAKKSTLDGKERFRAKGPECRRRAKVAVPKGRRRRPLWAAASD